MKAFDIIESLNKWAKPSLIDNWDNSGFLIGNDNKNIKKILIALDLDENILNIAIDENFDMVITHHPLIFKPINKITNNTYDGNLILNIIKKDIILFTAHSNLDLAKEGVNDVLAKKLGLKNLKDLNLVFKDEIYDYGYGRIGEVQEINLMQYLKIVKSKLDVEYLKVYGETDRIVSKIAICGGSGSSFIKDAYRAGAEVYITGDIKYHDGQLGHKLGMTIVDAGHYHTEKHILPEIKKYLLNNIDGDLEIKVIMDPSLPKGIY